MTKRQAAVQIGRMWRERSSRTVAIFAARICRGRCQRATGALGRCPHSVAKDPRARTSRVRRGPRGQETENAAAGRRADAWVL